MPAQHPFFIYEVLRKAFLLGLRMKPIFDYLDAQPGEHILDAGCGFGHLARHFNHCRYTGIDFDADRIEWAKNNIGETENRKFIAGDITKIQFEDGAFDKTIGYGLLHHLSDSQVNDCLQELSRVTRTRIVFSDPVYSQYHFINNLLCKMDQGEYVRGSAAYDAICTGSLTPEKSRYFYARNGLAKYYLTSFLPGKAVTAQ